MYENELYHYGVKGMKWGVRKAEYKAMSRSQKRDTKRKYKQNELDRKAEKRVDKHGIGVANAISRGKGAVKNGIDRFARNREFVRRFKTIYDH